MNRPLRMQSRFSNSRATSPVGEVAFRLLLLVAMLIGQNAFLWIYTGGGFVLDESTSAGARYYSIFRYGLTIVLVGYLSVMSYISPHFRVGWRESTAALALVFLVGVSVIWGAYPWDGFRSFVTFLLLSLVGTAAFIGVPTEVGIRRMRWLMVSFILINAVFALAFSGLARQAAGFGGAYSGALRGILSNKNSFGAALAPAMLFVVVTSPTGRSMLQMMVNFGVLATGFVMLVLSQSASSMIAFIVPLMILVFGRAVLAPGNRPDTRVLLGLTGGLVAIVTLAAISVFSEEIAAVFGRDPTLTGRTAIWDLMLKAISNRPILGYGFGSFWQDYVGDNGKLAQLGFWQIAEAHNGFIEMLLATGIVGLLVQLWLFGFLLLRSASTLLIDPEDRSSGLALLLVLQVFIQNISESAYPRPNHLSGMMMMVACILVHRGYRQVSGAFVGRPRPGRRTNSFQPGKE